MTRDQMLKVLTDHFAGRSYASSRWGRGISVDQPSGQLEAADYILKPGGPVEALIRAIEHEAAEDTERLYERIQGMNGTQ